MENEVAIYIDVDADGTVCVYDGDVEDSFEAYDFPYTAQTKDCSTYRLDDLIALGEEVKRRSDSRRLDNDF